MPKFANIRIWILVFLISGSIGSMSCSRERDQSGPVRVGAVLPLTGNLAFLGEAIRNGMELATEEINATARKENRQFLVIYEDSKGNPSDGVSAVRKLIDADKVKYLIINLTSVALASGPILDETNTLGLVLSTHPQILKGRKNLVRIFVSGVQESDLIAEYVRLKEYTSFSILHVNDSYGKGTGDFLGLKLNSLGDVLGIHYYDLIERDFRSALTKIRREDPQVLIVIGYGQEYPTLFRQMAEFLLQPTIISNLSFANVAGQAILKELRLNTAYVAPAFLKVEWRTRESKKFAEKYERRYDRMPDFNAAYGYDNIKLLDKAIREAASDSVKDVNKALRGIKGYQGAIGRIDILENGESITDMRMIEGFGSE